MAGVAALLAVTALAPAQTGTGVGQGGNTTMEGGVVGAGGRSGPAGASFLMMDGRPVYMRDLAPGQHVFLFFIRNGDNVARQAAPYVNRMVRAYSGGRAKWFGVFTDRTDRARSWQAEFNPQYRLLLDPSLAAVQAFRVESSPTIVHVGPNGRVLNTWRGLSGYGMKQLNRAVARANGRRVARLDFSRLPNSTNYGEAFVIGRTRP